MVKRIKQNWVYQKAVKDGFISEIQKNGQSIWFIKSHAPENVKALGTKL
jgi:hypothetical protein|tara:strand:+ start:951 stop:1097 length:147 start_codon:yes stop_codon:yes gene_type:complete